MHDRVEQMRPGVRLDEPREDLEVLRQRSRVPGPRAPAAA
jgi:hypothetical protein